MCTHELIISDYATKICIKCGLETEYGLPTSEGYTENIPLDIGYSRYNRMSTLLNKLFSPLLFGTPNSRVMYEVLQQQFKNGAELLQWLSKLNLKNKRYPNAHYYYAAHNRKYKVPPPPSKTTVRKILGVFHKLECVFENRVHQYKSFFSYNWLLRKFLVDFKLNRYLQFVKRIKCKKRLNIYRVMYESFMSLGNAEANSGVSPDYRTPRVSPQDGVSKLLRAALASSDLARERSPSRTVAVT